MKIILIGNGTIAKAIASLLDKKHELVIASRNTGDVQVDISNPESIKKMFKEVGKFDALISAAGESGFGTFYELKDADFELSFKSKLGGQIRLVVEGLKYINNSGSFTLTSGTLNKDPIKYAVMASVSSGGIESFVRAAAIEMPNGVRINAVSPTILEESMEEYGEYFKGFEPVSSKRVGNAYIKSLEGAQTGQVYYVE